MLNSLDKLQSPMLSILRTPGGGYYKIIPGQPGIRITQQEAMRIALEELDWEDKFTPHNID